MRHCRVGVRLNAGAVFDVEYANAADMRRALQREVWRHNNRSVAAATSPQLFVYDTAIDMSLQFQLSKSRTSTNPCFSHNYTFTYTKAEVMRSGPFVCHSFCLRAGLLQK